MATYDKLVSASTLEEAYELNQKRTNVILGGFMWLRQSSRHFQTAIDLSKLNLSGIDETDEMFSIGCMCTLRELECHEGLNREFQGSFKKALDHIVGVQFRNGATVGGSIYGRFGFSDVLTCLMALDSYVQLYKGGIIPLREFAEGKEINDLLMGILVKKDQRRMAYYSHRLSKTDFPVIAVGISRKERDCFISVGARPERAGLLERRDLFSGDLSYEETEALGKWAAGQFPYGTNTRGSADYRQHLAGVYIKRGIEALLNGR
jgi:CO/xanthine dehydrogenase FAD-binding subunit